MASKGIQGYSGVNMVWKDEAATFSTSVGPVGQKIDKSTPHRFTALGPDCICGMGRYTAVHFNGDAVLARAAKAQAAKNAADKAVWQSAIKPHDRVQVSDDHPRDDLVGRTGTVQQVTRGGGNEMACVVKFTGPVVATYTIPARYLQEINIRAEVPEFDTEAEADQWMEDRAKELGIVPDRTVPFFANPEEAEEWLERQAGEPYVPPSWKDLAVGEVPKSWLDAIKASHSAAEGQSVNDQVFNLLKGAIPQVGDMVTYDTGALNVQGIYKAIDIINNKIVPE